MASILEIKLKIGRKTFFAFFWTAAYPPTAEGSAGPLTARLQDCWLHRGGWSGAPAPEADSSTTKEIQSSQAERA